MLNVYMHIGIAALSEAQKGSELNHRLRSSHDGYSSPRPGTLKVIFGKLSFDLKLLNKFSL